MVDSGINVLLVRGTKLQERREEFLPKTLLRIYSVGERTRSRKWVEIVMKEEL